MKTQSYKGIELNEHSVRRALGLVKHFGFGATPNLRGLLESAVENNLCTQEQVYNAETDYLKRYFQD